MLAYIILSTDILNVKYQSGPTHFFVEMSSVLWYCVVPS